MAQIHTALIPPKSFCLTFSTGHMPLKAWRQPIKTTRHGAYCGIIWDENCINQSHCDALFFFFFFLGAPVSAVSKMDMQTTDHTAPVKMLLSFIVSVQPPL